MTEQVSIEEIAKIAKIDIKNIMINAEGEMLYLIRGATVYSKELIKLQKHFRVFYSQTGDLVLAQKVEKQ